MAFELPPVPYPYDALEPHVDARTMEIHHTKHHQAYTDKLNAAVAGTEHEGRTAEQIIGNLDALPETIRTAVRNNGGGYVNHKLFWNAMSPDGGGTPTGDLARAIDEAFGSFDAFKAEFEKTAVGQFGSGWAWLAYGADQGLHLHGMANQDNPLMHGHAPILGVDVWEHAYYLNYQNRRPDYLKAWWNTVNWNEADRLYRAATGRS